MRVISGMVVALLALASGAQADMLGARVGLEYWQAEPVVTAGDPGKAGQLSLQDTGERAWFGRFEHPLPLLPNLAVRYQQSSVTTQSALPQRVELSQKVFSAGTVTTQYTAHKYTDITGYYEVFDNPVFSIDLGLTARRQQADIRLSTATTAASADLSVLLPMLFVDAELGLWGTDTHWFLQGNYTKYQGDRNYDWRSGIAWRFIDIAMLQAHLRVGWQRAQTVITNRDQLDFHAKNDGGFIGFDVDF